MADFPEIFKSIFYIILLITMFVVGYSSSAKFHKTVYKINYEDALEDATFFYMLSGSCLLYENSRGEREQYVFDLDKISSGDNGRVSCENAPKNNNGEILFIKGELKEDCIPFLGPNKNDFFEYKIKIKIPYYLTDKNSKNSNSGFLEQISDDLKNDADINGCLKNSLKAAKNDKTKKDLYLTILFTDNEDVKIQKKAFALLRYKEKKKEGNIERVVFKDIPVIVEYGLNKKGQKENNEENYFNEPMGMA